MQSTYELLYALFLDHSISGYFGPFALVVFGYLLTKKSKALGILFFVVDCLFIAQYLALIEATPYYWWHVLIILLGVLLLCIPALTDR
jgi:uncharacterized membrane protein YczE